MGTVPVLPPFSAGEVVPASKLVALNTALAFLLSPPEAYVYRNAAASTATATWTVITWDVELKDNDTMVDIAGQPTRVVFKTPGKFRVEGLMTWATNNTGYREIQVRKNSGGAVGGGTQLQYVTGQATTGDQHAGLFTVAPTVAVNDYVEIFTRQGSGGTLSYTPGQVNMFAQATWIGQ